MITCPNCLKKQNDGTHYCDECGFDLLHEATHPSAEEQNNETQVNAEETVENTDEAVEVSEGESVETDVYTGEDDYLNIDDEGDDMPYDRVKSKKKNSRKVRRFNKKKTVKIVCISLAALLLVSAVAVVLSIIFAEKVYPGYALYVKDGELMYRNFDTSVTVELPLNPDDVADFEMYGDLCRLSDDGSALIFPKEYTYGDQNMDLCYLNLEVKNTEPIDIGYNVIAYSVNKDADTITYLRENDDGNVLFRYTVYNGRRVKIDEGVKNFVASDDGESVIYFETSTAIYKYDGSKTTKISSDATIAFSADKKLYYCKEEEIDDGYQQALYYYDGKNSVKVLDECLEVITTVDALNAAIVLAYEDDSEALYYVANGSATDLGIEDADFFMYNHWIDEDGKTMYFLDEVDESDSDEYTWDEALLYKAELTKKGVKKIEEIDEDVNIGYFIDKDKFVYFKNTVYNYNSMISDVYLNGELVDTDVTRIVGNDGKKLIYVKDYDDEVFTMSLYKDGKTIADGIIGAFMIDGELMYVNEADEDLYDIYSDGKLVAEGVYDFDYTAENKLVFFTDFDAYKECGTINIYQDGKVKSYGGDVFSHKITLSGDVVYIKDVDSTGSGDMYYVKDGAEVRLDKDIDTYYLDIMDCIGTIGDSNYVVIDTVLNDYYQ